jgi:hypothetical protein
MKFTFVIEEAMANAMVNLIAEGPYKIAAPILNELQKQVKMQQISPDNEESAQSMTEQ